jgi:TolB-like protein/Flp pilus assembly protein TadD
MDLGTLDKKIVRLQLDRVLASGGFSRNERLSRFLRFVVERHLEGRENELKEAVIGIEVCNNPDYDPKQDSIVRTEAGRLRARLAEYYTHQGNADPLIIELPKGGYTPVFRQPDVRALADHKKRWSARSAPRLMIALAGLAVVLGAVGWWWVQHKRALIPIAVLPLNNLSQDPANDYFADGLTDELIRNLSIIDGLAVRSQTSSFAFKGKPRNIREAGKQLEADYILEGSVLRAGQQLRINAQLIRVRDDFPLWSARYDRELTDVLSIQDDISRGIVNSLRLKLGRGRRRYETSTEAYDLYLRARAVTIQRGIPGYDQSIGPFEEAIAKDPSFAPAYAGLAAAYAVRSARFRFDGAGELARMRALSEKAIQLDPLSAEAHDALGMARSRDAQWKQAEESFRRAIELDGNGSESHFHFAVYHLWPVGRIEEALEQLHAAERIDPLSPRVHFNLALVLISAGRSHKAVAQCEKLPADFWATSGCLGRARLGQGRTGEAIQVLTTAVNRGGSAGPQAQLILGDLGYAYGRVGRREEAEKLAAAIPLDPIGQAEIFVGLGDKNRAFEALDRSTALGPFRIGWALTTPEFALLRGDPRLIALRKKVGLPE